MPRTHTDFESVVIGLFPRASDARRALSVLHEHHFSVDDASAAFREPSPAHVAEPPVRGSGRWFEQLRHVYHGVAPNENAQPGGFDAMLAQLDVSAQDATNLRGDLERCAAIITVTAGARYPEARTLLEHYGARIV